MLKEPIERALNAQINAELYSSYLYLSMSAHCLSNDLAGMGQWFRIQAQEELTHVMRIFDYINDRSGRVRLQPVEGPQIEWDSTLAIWQATLVHEQTVTEMINKLVDLSLEHSDHSTNNFLQWFVAEQVEEEASVSEILGQAKLIGDNPGGLFMLDKELGQRAFVAAADSAA